MIVADKKKTLASFSVYAQRLGELAFYWPVHPWLKLYCRHDTSKVTLLFSHAFNLWWFPACPGIYMLCVPVNESTC